MRAIHEEPVLNLYHAISDANNNAETYIATVVRGVHTGEKALIQDGKMIWNSEPEGFLASHESEIAGAGDSGIFDIAGEDVFVELLGNEKHVVICGAGHVSLPIISITRMLGMYVTVIDDREEFIEDARKYGANRVICKSFAEQVQNSALILSFLLVGDGGEGEQNADFGNQIMDLIHLFRRKFRLHLKNNVLHTLTLFLNFFIGNNTVSHKALKGRAFHNQFVHIQGP